MESDSWPRAGTELCIELERTGWLGLIVGSAPLAEGLVGRMVQELGLTSISIGEALASRDEPPASGTIEAVLGDATILIDIELLFSSVLKLDVIRFLARRGRQRATIALWPGEILGRRAAYGTRGRSDYQGSTLSSAVIIRPTPTRFPDEVPFEVERISP